MLSVRLPEKVEKKINKISEIEKITKTDIVTNALEKYICEYEKKSNPYELGKDLFGKAGTGDEESSTTYKRKVSEKINAKYRKFNN